MNEDERTFDDTLSDIEDELLGDEYVEPVPPKPDRLWKWWYVLVVLIFPPILLIALALFIIALAVIVTAKAH